MVSDIGYVMRFYTEFTKIINMGRISIINTG